MTWTIVVSLLLAGCSLVSACKFQRLEPSVNNDGYIMSPNYPGFYPSGTCRLWSLQRAPGTKVTIRILRLDLSRCDKNVLLIGPINQCHYCGNSQSKMFEPYTAVLSETVTHVYVLFNVSDSGANETGFYIYYKLTNVEPKRTSPSFPVEDTNNMSTITTNSSIHPSSQTPDKGTHSPRSNLPQHQGDIACHFTINGSGYIQSSDALLDSLRNYGSCSWQIKPSQPLGTEIMFILNFAYCDLHRRDVLEVIGKQAGKNRILGIYDSRTCPNILWPLGESVLVVYKPNQSMLNKLGVAQFRIRYSTHAHCLTGYLLCGNGEAGCFSAAKRCDGEWDCPLHGGDEMGCSAVCRTDEFSCNSSMNFCFKESDRCNGKGECANYMDEMNCTPERCSTSQGLFLCRNRRCIYEKWRCDHTIDCADESDEDDCPSTPPSPRVIVAAVVGALTCSIVLIAAMGCIRKVYTMRMQQLRSGHSRPETPLTRLQAELFRRRAPPPQYNEAMLTSRPYDQAYQELLINQAGSAATFDQNHQLSGNQNNGDPMSQLSGGGAGPHRNCRRFRRRSHHRSATRQDLSLQQGSGEENIRETTTDINHSGENILLMSSDMLDSSSRYHPTMYASASQDVDLACEERQPPPYSPRDPCPHRLPALASSSSESNDGDEEDDHDIIDDDDVPLLTLAMVRPAPPDMEMTTAAVGGGLITTTNTNLLSKRPASDRPHHWTTTIARDDTTAQDSSRGVEDTGDDENDDDSDKYGETASTSLSIDSDPLHHTSGLEIQEDKDGGGGSIMPVIDEDSDSDCILAADHDDICDDEEDDNGRNNEESDFDTALLLTHM